ncbi:MAG: hypothetical protein U0232_15650 [Thermomicrobiales bacterium]
MPQLDQAVEDWYSNDYRYNFLGGTELTFEPYTTTREQSLINAQHSLLDCTYPAYNRLGNWLKVWTARREYCTSSLAPADLLGSHCGTVKLTLSLTFFLGYLFQHPGRDTAPYLALLLLAVGLLVVALAYKARLGQFIATVKPSLGKLAFIIVVGIMVICAGGFLDTLLIMGLIYIVISFLLPHRNPATGGLNTASQSPPVPPHPPKPD